MFSKAFYFLQTTSKVKYPASTHLKSEFNERKKYPIFLGFLNHHFWILLQAFCAGKLFKMNEKFN